jgi:hypothetical protein
MVPCRPELATANFGEFHFLGTPVNNGLATHLSTRLPLLVTTNITPLGDVPMRTNFYTNLRGRCERDREGWP